MFALKLKLFILLIRLILRLAGAYFVSKHNSFDLLKRYGQVKSGLKYSIEKIQNTIHNELLGYHSQGTAQYARV